VLEPTALDLPDIAEWLQGHDLNLVLAGEGARTAAPHLADRLFRILDTRVYRPSARSVAALARPRLALGEFDDVTTFEPFYLKEFVAKKSVRTAFERLHAAGVRTDDARNA
jgi:tRNA threonylcarbamoyladenosine biosynthesis protein TsaB